MSGRRNLRWAMRAAQVRLRFFVAIAVAFLVVGRWDVIRAYWDRWTSPRSPDAAMGAVSSDTEYFCPMDPGVVSDWPGKCPICHMALVRRKKGDMGPMPSGVVARVQFSPERIQLAGIRVETVGYRPLAREIRSIGEVKREAGRTLVLAEVGKEEASWVETGLLAEVSADPPDGSPPMAGRVVAVEANRLTVELVDPTAVQWGRFASVAVRVAMADREPFRSMPRGEPPTREGEPRIVFVCPDHPDVIQTTSGRCPKDKNALERLVLARNQRMGWWCPMHPRVTSETAGNRCEACGGMTLVARIVSYCPVGEVLAVPESAVIDTGARSVVYLERMPGMFDAVEVRLGPRCGGFYPVVAGLEAGQSVASAGAFLVDAETRLNPALAAGYFGAKPGEPAKTRETLDLAGLSPGDRALAMAQGTCPVTGKKLGSMGTPFKVDWQGRSVFLCCDGCETSFKEAPRKDLSKPPAHHP